MTGRRQTGNRIRGPNSALTDFLAANNISAAQIRDDYERRRREAAGEPNPDDTNGDAQVPDEPTTAQASALHNNEEEEEVEEEEVEAESSRSSKRKRKANEAAAEAKKLAKIKKSKAFQRRKAARDADGGDSDSEYDDILAREMYKKTQPPPGQLDNCEICSKRFTVTSYSKTGPDGGLLCTPCGKELAAEEGSKKPKKQSQQKRKRKLESDRMEASHKSHGAKSLQQLCIEKVAQHHEDVEEFGELPEKVLERLGEIFSKQRVMTPRTLRLFLRSDLDAIAVHDAAYLETEDYNHMLASVPHIEKIVLRNACQFKDENIEYMLDKCKNVRFLHLYASNLVTDRVWKELFLRQGEKLEHLKLAWLDASFDDKVVDDMVQFCPNLVGLKLKLCRRFTAAAIDSIARLKKLQFLSLQTNADVDSECLINLIKSVGHGLQTLSLEHFLEADDDVLNIIHDQCRNLRKLRFSENDYCTDAAFTALFTDWANPPLRFADFNSTRDVDNSNPKGPEEPIGLASNGFRALMKHSGAGLEVLNLASCRHITNKAFWDVFCEGNFYPKLKKIDISFCNTVDTMIVAGIFKSCPKLDRLISFGNFSIEDVVVPRGIVLIGVPKAQDAIEQVGTAVGDDVGGFMDSLGAMGSMVGAAA
ncbi:uncharacterized protein J3D65DRAFT_608382 [Phyllosticta citribraziliensis]|uniref:DNA repair protein rhp7 treble clef domain-containing protein n=1 Tax=Phyllosticta citribraziliensis TaxID=989973 RepID=A0ABR1M9X0_9PEZI